MNKLNKLLAEIISILDETDFCSNTRILESTYFSPQQFAFKIRTKIFGSYKLQLRIYYNANHYDYSYQLFSDNPLCRWDNSEHFPRITSFPHHYHSIKGNILDSPLKGDPVSDLKLVLSELSNMLQAGE